MVNWWTSPLDAVTRDHFEPVNFGYHGIVPIGYTAFAFALGATTGVLLRRTVPAMGATLVGFVVARLAVEHLVRPNLASPLHQSLSVVRTGFGSLNLQYPAHTVSLIPPAETMPNSWVLPTAVVDRSGHALTGPHLRQSCPRYAEAGPATIQSIHATCMNKLLSASYHTVVTYQPASRFWPLQWAEMGKILAAALALCTLTYWWLRRQYA